jgi:hypothetical protein
MSKDVVPTESEHGETGVAYRGAGFLRRLGRGARRRTASEEDVLTPERQLEVAGQEYSGLAGGLMEAASRNVLGVTAEQVPRPRAFKGVLGANLHPAHQGILVIRDPAEVDRGDATSTEVALIDDGDDSKRPPELNREVPILDVFDYEMDEKLNMSLDPMDKFFLVRTTYYALTDGTVAVRRMPVQPGSLQVGSDGAIYCERDETRQLRRTNPRLDPEGMKALSARLAATTWEGAR